MSKPAPMAVLVHGIMDRGRIFRGLQSVLDDAGIASSAPNLRPNHGGAPLEVLAQQLAEHIEQHVPAEQPLHLLGFSMGAIVSRYYLQALGGIERTVQFLSVCAPHQGTRWSWLGPLPGMRQMRPGSALLERLNNDLDTLAQRPVTCYWTPYDLVVVPATSATLSMADNVRIESLCHQCILGHGQFQHDVRQRILALPERASPSESP